MLRRMMLRTDGRITILDGAVGTALGERGVDLSPPLWATRALIDTPETIEQLHREYLEVGADLISTNTFRSHARSLARAGMDAQAKGFVFRAVKLARDTRNAVNPNAKVLGVVGPLEDCYDPNAAPDERECVPEHRCMMDWLAEAGVDGVLIETMGTLREAEAASKQAREVLPGRWMISFLMQHDGPPGMLISGEPIVDVLASVRDAAAVGVNCLPAPEIAAHVEIMRSLLPDDVVVLAYGNTGRMNADGSWADTDATDPQRYAAYAEQWVKSGASIIGGCCGTNPATIAAVVDRCVR